MASPSLVPDRKRTLHDSLRRALDEPPGDESAGQLAARLLAADCARRLLVGVRDGVDRAVYADLRERSVVGVDLTETEGPDRLRYDRFAAEASPESWLVTTDASLWTWLHPRFRWVFD